MEVQMQVVKLKDLESTVKELKDNGHFILAVSPASFKMLKTSMKVETSVVISRS